MIHLWILGKKAGIVNAPPFASSTYPFVLEYLCGNGDNGGVVERTVTADRLDRVRQFNVNWKKIDGVQGLNVCLDLVNTADANRDRLFLNGHTS